MCNREQSVEAQAHMVSKDQRTIQKDMCLWNFQSRTLVK